MVCNYVTTLAVEMEALGDKHFQIVTGIRPKSDFLLLLIVCCDRDSGFGNSIPMQKYLVLDDRVG